MTCHDKYIRPPFMNVQLKSDKNIFYKMYFYYTLNPHIYLKPNSNFSSLFKNLTIFWRLIPLSLRFFSINIQIPKSPFFINFKIWERCLREKQY